MLTKFRGETKVAMTRKVMLIFLAVILTSGSFFLLFKPEKQYLECAGMLASTDAETGIKNAKAYRLNLDIERYGLLQRYSLGRDGFILTRPGLLTNGYNIKHLDYKFVLFSNTNEPVGEYYIPRDKLILDTRHGKYNGSCKLLSPAMAEWLD